MGKSGSVYERAKDIFIDALELTGDERDSFVDKSCGSDSKLRRELQRLFAHHDQSDAFLNGPALDALGHTEIDRLAGLSDRSQPDDVWRPERIEGYRILEVIAHGGMGIVYKAEQDAPARTVAVKVIAHGGTSSTKILRRFEHEAQVLGRLQHPGIAQVFEAGEVDTEFGPRPFFAMEFVRGLNITRFAEHHELGLRPRLELVAQICDAVQHAHQKGVIHRDLKPDNILVDDEGQPKILDFGIAKLTDSDTGAITMQTEIGQLIGTLEYMSPEQTIGDPSDIDVRSDVYSLGVVAYQLLTGRLPYDLKSKSVPETTRVIQQDDPTTAGVVNPILRGDIETILGKSLEKDRDRRYQSASDLARDVRRYLDNEPIAARPPSTVYQVKKFARRHRGLVAGLACAFAILLSSTIVTSVLALNLWRSQQQTSVAWNAHLDVILGTREPEVRGMDPSQLRYLLQKESRKLARQEVASLELLSGRYDALGQAFLSMAQSNDVHDPDRVRAVNHFEESFKLKLELHGPSDVVTLRAADILSDLYCAQRQIANARRILDSVELIKRPRNKREAKWNCHIRHDYAILHVKEGEYKKADAILSEVWLQINTLGLRHEPYGLEFMLDYADKLDRLGQTSEALELLREAYDERLKLNQDDQETYRTLTKYAKQHLSNGDALTALQLLQDSIAELTRINSNDTRLIEETRGALGLAAVVLFLSSR